jgi:hypothetical protein
MVRSTNKRGMVDRRKRSVFTLHPRASNQSLGQKAVDRNRIALAALFVLCGWLLPQVSFAEENADRDDTVYLFTSFRGNGEDGLRFLHSTDGYHWQNVAGTFLKPAVGPSKLMRDPSLLRGPDGTFHLVWTTGWQHDQGFGYAHSKDLVNWSEQRFVPVMEHEPTTVNVWAPELFYDAPNQRFIICWASTIPGRFPDHLEPRDNNQRMYYTTTRDFQEFAPAQLFFDPGFSVIDCVIVKRADRDYVLVLKENTRPQRSLRVAFGETPLGPWRDVSPTFTKNFTEGPSVLKLENDWIIYYDAYRDAHYGAATTSDFKQFADVTKEVTFPEGHKHGTVIKVNKTVLNELLGANAQPASDVRRDSAN